MANLNSIEQDNTANYLPVANTIYSCDKHCTFSLETSTRVVSYENARKINSVEMAVHVVLVFVE